MLGHNRYSTNTWPAFRRVQPFGVLGHNGEINTVGRLRQEARMLGVPLPRDGSDSQDLARTVEALIHRDGLTLAEALELVLPPIVNEIKGMPEELRGFYMYLRQAFGPLAQGPVALVARHGDECVFSVDALGPAPALVDGDRRGVRLLQRSGSGPGRRHGGGAQAARARREADGHARPRGAAPDAARPSRDAAALLPAVARADRERRPDETFAQAIPVGGPLNGPEIPGYTSAGPSEPVKVPIACWGDSAGSATT